MIIACCAHSTNAHCNEPLNNPETDEEFNLIDFSYQNLSALPDFVVENASVVQHLILDGNRLDESSIVGEFRFPQLETLSFNCNQIENIGVFVQRLSNKCPNLRFLSLIDNPGWPHPLRTNNTRLYKNYIKSILKFFPKLRFLDSFEVEARKLSSASSTGYSSSSSTN